MNWSLTEAIQYGYLNAEDNKALRRIAKQHAGECKGLPVRGVLGRQDVTVTFREGTVTHPLANPRDRLKAFEDALRVEVPGAFNFRERAR